jgi:hypothetical protein
MNTALPVVIPNLSLPAPKIILMGAPGTGKTWSIHTLLAAGIEVFMIATEANATDSVLDACKRANIPVDRFHWKYCLPAAASWDSLFKMADVSNKLAYEDLAKLKTGVDRAQTAQFGGLIKTFADFRCDHCGKSFGDCAQWDGSRALVLDSLSGVNLLSRYNHVGFKPTMHEGEWGVIMSNEETLINSLCNGLRCWFILMAHIEREPDQITGGTRITVSALGKKLAPKLGNFFSEVVLDTKNKDKFTWSTSETGTDVKNRALPISDALNPTFAPIVAVYKQRQSQTTDQPATVAPVV